MGGVIIIRQLNINVLGVCMVTLVILDGFGLNDKTEGNAIKLQGTPNLNKLNVYPYTTLIASGEGVGLNDGQMGNSEVGHLNLGAGRVVYQDLPRINNDIKTGAFFDNEQFVKVCKHVKDNNSSLHLMGLVSTGGVHSHLNHVKALVDLANRNGVNNVYIHAITDGRDTLTNSGIGFIKDLNNYIQGKAKIATICGRVYAMDRELRWERVKKAYDMLVYGKAEFKANSPEEAMQNSYNNNVYDEFIEPVIIEDATINENDGFIFFNYRTDRAREITQAIMERPFDKFEVKTFNNLCYVCMTEYSSDFKNVVVAYPPEKIENNLSNIISANGLKQFHVSETTKYAHVTFFFNGGIEKANVGEDRQLVDSVDVQDFSSVPNMRALEITEKVKEAIRSNKYDFVLVNLSNPDMIGHTGNLESAIKAIETCDRCAYEIAMETLNAGGECIITADHGNAEEMIDSNGNVLTQHTTNPVPLWLVSNKNKDVKLSSGKLCNVAPTILKLLNIQIPDYMEDPLF